MTQIAVKSISIRAATVVDQEHIAGMIRSERLNPFGLHWRNFIVAVESSEEIVGVGQLKPHWGCVELASLVVAPAWRGRGVARLLMERLMEMGDFPLWLMCAQRLTPFYEQFGFIQITDWRRMPAYFRWIFGAASLFGRLSPYGSQLAIMAANGLPSTE